MSVRHGNGHCGTDHDEDPGRHTATLKIVSTLNCAAMRQGEHTISFTMTKYLLSRASINAVSLPSSESSSPSSGTHIRGTGRVIVAPEKGSTKSKQCKRRYTSQLPEAVTKPFSQPAKWSGSPGACCRMYCHPWVQAAQWWRQPDLLYGGAPLRAYSAKADSVNVDRQAAKHKARELQRDFWPRKRRPLHELSRSWRQRKRGTWHVSVRLHVHPEGSTRYNKHS
jgi:hypothetical protein